ncbi:MAG: DsbA family protein [Proteobacteria bacterium]|nr:DsbA family protein [Pseudomonadota bacterium]
MQRNVTSTLRALLAPALVVLAGTAGCASTAPPVAVPVATPATAEKSRADDRILGSTGARVMIIEFTDLQCPYCARFASDTWPLLRERYVDTGKVRFATRDLPLPMHEFAVPAAVATRCAGQQGKFWEYREALFRDQSLLSQGRYAELAGRFGLDGTRFESCRADPAVLAAVRADAALAASSGIASTPSFVIGLVTNGEFAGEVMSGAKSFEVFQQRLDSLLQQSQE